MKKIALSLVLIFTLFSPKAFGAESDLGASLDAINFGHEGTEKTLYLTNKAASDFFWSARTNAPWLTVDPALGKIDNIERIPANAPYQFSNMWPKLPQPWYFIGVESVGIDHEGSIYVVDEGAKRVKKFNKYEEFLFEVGSNNPKDQEYLNSPKHIAFDSQNNFYVTLGSKIKKFDKNGRFIATIKKDKLLGTGYFDIAIDSQDNIYVTDAPNKCVDKFDLGGNHLKSWGENGAGDGEFESSNSQLGIVIDSKDNIYVADNHYGRIQKFDSEGNFMKKWGNSRYDDDWQLGEVFFIDSQDTIYICHEHSEQIYKFDTELNQIPFEWKDKRPWWGNFYMNDAAISKNGIIYLATDEDWNRTDGRSIIKFDGSGNRLGILTSYDENKNGMFYLPVNISIDKDGVTYVYSWNQFQVFNREGEFMAKWEFSRYRDIHFSITKTVATGPDKSVYILASDSLAKFDKEGNIINIWKNDKFSNIKNITLDSAGNIYALFSKFDSHTFLLKIDAAGNIIGEWNKDILPDTWHSGKSIAVDSHSNIYIADDSNLKIYKLDQEGNLIISWVPVSLLSSSTIVSLAVDNRDNIYAIFYDSEDEIHKYDNSGNLLCKWGNRGSKEGELFAPSAIAVGPDGRVYVADTDNRRIQVFSQAVQPVKVSLDRSKLPSRTNEARLELYNDANASQAPVGVQVLAYGANHAPVLASISNKTVDEGRLLEFTLAATDADGDTITYSATGFPPGANFDGSSRKFSWTPSKIQSGTYQVTFHVSDSELSSSGTINIIVNDVPNQPPIARIGTNDVRGRSPLKVRFSSNGSSDPDGTISWYLWDFGDGSTSSGRNPEHTFRNSTRADVTCRVVLTVIDNEGAQSTAETTITVRPKKKQSWWGKLWPF